MKLTINKKRMFLILALGLVVIFGVMHFITKVWPDIEFTAIRDQYETKAKEMSIGVTIEDEQVYGDDINSLNNPVALLKEGETIYDFGDASIENAVMTDIVYFPEAKLISFGTIVPSDKAASLKPLGVEIVEKETGLKVSGAYVNNLVLHSDEGLLLTHVKLASPLEDGKSYEIMLAGSNTEGHQISMDLTCTYMNTRPAQGE